MVVEERREVKSVDGHVIFVVSHATHFPLYLREDHHLKLWLDNLNLFQ
jgi:hypothetical protein